MPTVNSSSTPLRSAIIPSASPARASRRLLRTVIVISGSMPVVHIQLQLATINESVTASASPAVLPTDSFTPITLVSGLDIERTPGADRTNSMAMITDYVPGTYVTHDMLHMRGGHQVTWLLDGIPIINTAIAQNLGPQFDPKDMDYVEVNRGSYAAEFGDRTYGVFNVVPRTGFERNNEGRTRLDRRQLLPDRRCTSASAATPSASPITPASMATAAISACSRPFLKSCTTLSTARRLRKLSSFNVNPSNQLRLMTSLRRDYLPDPVRSESQRHRERIDSGQRLYPAIPQHRTSRQPN